MTEDDAERSIVEAVLALAERFGLEVVAEGVERGAQAALLHALGCRYAQGWLFGRPVSERELRARLAGTQEIR